VEKDGMNKTVTTEMEKGQRKCEPEKKQKGEDKREDKKGERRSKRDYEDGKGEDIILERSTFKKKDEEFWNYVRQFQIVGLVETWVEERSWEKIEKLLPKEYKWECQGAKRGKKKERAAGE
jgi:hypothetical protein